MRQAYPGNYGYGPYTTSAVTGGVSDSDRLSNLKQAIDSIEQRLAGAPVPPYTQMPVGQIPSHSQLSAMQAQLNHLAGQLRTPLPSNPVHSAGVPQDVNSAAAAIAQRQQMLNAGAAAQRAEAVAAQRAEVAAAQRADAKATQVTNDSMALITDQLESLKQELAGIKSQVAKPVAIQNSVPQEEIDRIAMAISELQTQPEPDDSAFDRLTVELDQLRKVMKHDVRAAVEEEIQTNHAAVQASSVAMQESAETHAAALHARLDSLARSLEEMSVQSANQVTPRVDGLSGQLDALRVTVDDLPQTLAISRLEEHLQSVAQKMDELSTRSLEQPSIPAQPGIAEEDLANIEKRLDEISRALVAVSNSSGKVQEVDLSAVDRVEARMKELARTIDGIAANDSAEELGNLAIRIDGLTERLGSFEKYAEAGDLGAANAMFAAPDTGIIEDQLRALNARLDDTMAQSQTAALEDQIRQLSARVEEASNVNSTAAQMSNLEAQIGQIIRQMGKQDGGAPVDFSPVEARLGQIETHLASNQSNSIEAAQQAAQQAVARMGSQSEPGQIIEALSHDLKALQLASQGGVSQNAQTAQQVQSALEQVIDRLGSIEGAIEEVATRAATVVAAPSQQMPPAANLVMPSAVQPGVQDTAIPSNEPGVIHKAAMDAGFVEQPYGALEGQAPTPTQMDAPSIDPTDHLERDMASSPEDNMPLEPGSTVPDVDRLVEQASAQLQNEQTDASNLQPAHRLDDTRPDAVAAARRALQATTAEMNAVRDEVQVEKKSDSAIAGLKSKLEKMAPGFDMGKLRKPLVMGAAALLLAIVAFKGVGMFAGGDPKPVANIDVPAVEMSTGEAPKTDLADAAGARETPVRTIGEISSNGDGTTVVPKQMVTDDQKSEPVGDAMATAEMKKPDTAVDEKVAEPTPASVSTEDAQKTPVETKPAQNQDFEVPATAGPAALVAAANTGNPKALFQIGMRYSNGNEVKRNISESAKWFERSANTGFAPAQYSIGSLYEKGIGVERDIAKASQWYEKASVQGNARAMHNLAVIKAMGNPPEVQPDMETAVGLFKKAANFGIKDSQFNLGILYGQGMGVPQNLSESYKWFALAAKTGDSDAGKKRDEVANAMDPDDLDDARKEVNNWAPRKLKEAENRVSIPEEWKGRNREIKTKEVKGTSAVKKAQFLLNQRGFSVGTPDGVIGPKTKRAIMEFQRSAGIPITGRVDKKLLQALDVQT